MLYFGPLLGCEKIRVIKFNNSSILQFTVNGPIIRRLLNSLMAMMGMLVGGFLVNNLIQILYDFVEISDPIKAHISIVMAWLPALAFASNTPILIIFR
jgi:hypothetical protein